MSLYVAVLVRHHRVAVKELFLFHILLAKQTLLMPAQQTLPLTQCCYNLDTPLGLCVIIKLNCDCIDLH